MANRQVIKVVHVEPGDTAESVAGAMETGSAIAVMLDAGGGASLGGTGTRIDWDVARVLSQTMPVWLAGGLNPENVAEAVETVRPWAVDVSSGIEMNGAKDLQKMRDFVRAVKGDA
jgi:phosphoribosylanthranilate isomerase